MPPSADNAGATGVVPLSDSDNAVTSASLSQRHWFPPPARIDRTARDALIPTVVGFGAAGFLTSLGYTIVHPLPLSRVMPAMTVNFAFVGLFYGGSRLLLSERANIDFDSAMNTGIAGALSLSANVIASGRPRLIGKAAIMGAAAALTVHIHPQNVSVV